MAAINIKYVFTDVSKNKERSGTNVFISDHSYFSF